MVAIEVESLLLVEAEEEEEDDDDECKRLLIWMVDPLCV